MDTVIFALMQCHMKTCYFFLLAGVLFAVRLVYLAVNENLLCSVLDQSQIVVLFYTYVCLRFFDQQRYC